MLNLSAGAIVTMDRGYNDYSLFASWCERGVYFVTRVKKDATYEVVTQREAKPEKNILADETITFSAPQSKEKCPYQLRLVSFYDVKKERIMHFLTNNFKLAATTIAAIYKDRWQIELFFKAIKQNLQVKTFLGTSENAVKSQLWTALLAMLLLDKMIERAYSKVCPSMHTWVML
jgi:IS4 transposase